MKLNNLYTYPTTERMEIEGKRRYVIKGQTEPLPSVTTILAATQPEEKKAALAAWQARVGQNEAEKIKNNSAARGTVVHHYLEGWLKNKPHLDLTEVGQLAEKMAYQIWNNTIESRITELWGIEPTVFHSGMGYAGAVDLICIHDGVPTLCDWKQSNKPKRKEWIKDYGLQIAAYSLAFQDMFGETIHKGVNSICTPDLYHQEFIWEGEEFKQLKYEWMKRVQKYYEMKDKGQI